MTTTTAHAPVTTDTSRPRRLLRVDAALCAATGLVAAVAAPAVSELLGPDVPTRLVRVVGLALVLYALDLAVVSRGADRWQQPAVLVAGIGSIAWEVATIVLVLLGAFSVPGAVVALALAAAVGLLGVLQVRAARAC